MKLIIFLIFFSTTLLASEKKQFQIEFDFSFVDSTILLLDKGISSDLKKIDPHVIEAFCEYNKCNPKNFLKSLDQKRQNFHDSRYNFNYNSEQVNQFSKTISFIKYNIETIKNNLAKYINLNIPNYNFNFHYKIYITVGGNASAYVKEIDGKPILIVDISQLNNEKDLTKALSFINAAAYHEVWHGLFLQYIKRNWKISNPFDNINNADYHLLFSMLNEGYGHYMSLLVFYNFDNDEIIKKLDSKSATFIDLFSNKFLEFRNEADYDKKIAKMFASQSEDMYSKWGAMTGSYMIAKLIKNIGKEQVLNLLKDNTYQIFKAYETNFKDDTRIPKEFYDLVKKIEKMQQDNTLN